MNPVLTGDTCNSTIRPLDAAVIPVHLTLASNTLQVIDGRIRSAYIFKRSYIFQHIIKLEIAYMQQVL